MRKHANINKEYRVQLKKCVRPILKKLEYFGISLFHLFIHFLHLIYFNVCVVCEKVGMCKESRRK